MKKILHGWPAYNRAPKMLRVMKLTAYLLLFSIMQVAGAAHSQSDKMNLVVRNAPIKHVFQQIEQNSSYRFFYSDDLIDINTKVTIKAGERNVQEIMEEVTRQSRISYQILEDNLIVIKPSEVQQDLVVNGRITSMMEGEGLPGVNVIVKGTQLGTISDVDGNFSLKVEDPNAVLIISYVGFVTEEINLEGRSVLDVVLAESLEALEEIIVTGLSIERNRESLGYSVSQVSGKEVNTVKTDNFANALSGKVSGLQITESQTGVGGSTRIVLRGVSSMLGNNRPLFVIDGVPMPSGYNAGNNPNKDGGDALADINPEDIESISVLKGAGAAAVYGSRGANGVILIQTKKGTLGSGLGLGFSTTYTSEMPFILPDLQNTYGQGGLRGQYPITNPNNTVLDHPNIWSYGPLMDGDDRINWVGEEEPYSPQGDQMADFLRNGSSMINNVNLESANENSSLRVSLTDQRSKGISPNNDLSRQTLSIRGFSKINKIFEIDAKINYMHHNVKNRPELRENGGNSPLSFAILPRNITTESLKNNTVDEYGDEMTWALDQTFGNPYWTIANQGNNDIKNRYQTTVSVKTIFNNKWNLLLRTGLDQYGIEDKNWVNKGSKTASNGRGWYSHSKSSGFEWNSDFLLSYSDSKGDISYGVNLGGNFLMDRYNSINQDGSGLQIPGYYHISNLSEYYTGEYRSEKEVASLYALGNISFGDNVYVDLLYRSDWSSSLPLDNNQYNYYSANVSWLFSNTFDISSIFSTGKLRGSIAQTGNDTGPYQLETVYGVVQSPFPYSQVSIPGTLLTPDLLPEITNTWEIGTELGFFANRLMFDFTYYYSLGKNQIMPVTLPKSTGYDSKKLNSGELQNTGIELQLNAAILELSNGFNWNAILNYTRNKSLVKSINPDLESLPLNSAWHAQILATPGQEYGQIVGYDYKRDENGTLLLNRLGQPQRGELIAQGSINPDYIFGFTNAFSYKGFTLSVLIDGSMGSEIYSWGKTYKMLWGTDAETLEGRAEWFETHDKNGLPIPGVEPEGYVFEGLIEDTGEPNTIPLSDPAYRGYIPYNTRVIYGSVLDASSIRIREAFLSYSFPRDLVSRIKMTNLVLTITGRNLFFFYKPADHIDPEAGYSSGNTGNGLEQTTLPSTRSVGFNLRFSF